MSELSIIQKTYDLIKWYIPILNRLPKNHRFALGDRMINELYSLLEGLIIARYQKEKLTQLELLQSKLDILRYQTRLLSGKAEGRRQKAEGNSDSCTLPVTKRVLGLKPRRLHGAYNWAGSESPSNCSFCPLPSAFCLLQLTLI